MPKVSVDKIKPGMKLAKPIINEINVVLIGEGVELNDALIKRIKDMGLSSVYVEGISKPKKPIEEALSELNERFKKSENQPHMYLLKKIFRESIEEIYKKNG